MRARVLLRALSSAHPTRLSALAMMDIDRAIRHVLDDPWTARFFLAFTVGLLLSCSAEFAAGQGIPLSADRPEVVARAQVAMSAFGIEDSTW